MLAILEHRGPDDCGSVTTDNASLGARRLAIIDVEGGHQPVTNEDGSVTAVLNGEIYNYAEIRALLEQRGHRFRSHVDTELLPHLYEEFGAELFGRLRGMFAIAIWDNAAQRLILGRDRAGEKPLLYAKTDRGIAFASELKALLLDPALDRDLDPSALRVYLTMQYIPGPGTILRSVSRLPAGHFLVAERGTIRIEGYWQLDPAPLPLEASRAGVVETLRATLEDAVAVQMHADVPVGALLSGGIDSAGIVALMKHAGGATPRTFTVGFAHAAFDEREPARAVARAIGTDHTELLVGEPGAETLREFVWHLDEPIADQAAFPTFLIAKVASEHVKVVLTGEGSDELFGGYPRYRWFRRALQLDALPRVVGAPLQRLAARSRGAREADLFFTRRSLLERHVAWTCVFGDAELSELLTPDVAGSGVADSVARLEPFLAGWAGRPGVEQAMALDFKTWLVDDILFKADRMSMGASIEARAPYLDQKVIDFAARIPLSLRLAGRETKPLLREALAGLLPREVLGRRKSSFDVPVARWLSGTLASTVADALLDPGAASAAYIRRPVLERLLRDQRSAADGRRIWALAVLELWLKTVLEAAPLAADGF
jgi:asparagine synthase (glutamine-hydrolysing)